MTTDNSKEINVDNLAKAIAADIGKLTKNAAKSGKLKSVREIDLSPLLKGAGAKKLQGAANSLKAKAAASSKKNEAETSIISEEIKTSIQERQTRLASDLKELSKTEINKDAEAKIILNRVSADVELKARLVDEIQLEKRVKPVISPISPLVRSNIRPGQ
jgi:hypothetical protein